MKIALRILAVIVLIIAGLVIFIQFTWEKKFDAPYPEIQASTDPAVIERGRYLAFGPAHCGTCHVPMDKIMEVENGLEIPLSGGWELTIPPGTFRAGNITPDSETGIGRYSDGELARILRHGVHVNNTCVMPFMPFNDMSEEDMVAIISFIRSQQPVKHEMKRSEYSFLGKAVMAFGLIKPNGPNGTPPKSVKIDTTVEYGKYMANSVANCVGCHTIRDLKTGEFTGVPFAGGLHMPPDDFSKGYAFVTPNLTPDKETGVMAFWDESTFINRFRNGRVHEGSPMPWGAFSRINDLELKAIFRYLKSLEPVKLSVPKTVFAPGEKLP